MSTLKSVGNKLFKTNLESQRVELGIAEDLDKLATEGKSLYDAFGKDNSDWLKADKLFNETKKQIKSIQAEALKKVNKMVALQSKINAAMLKAETTAKDLGIDVKTIPSYKSADSILSDLEMWDENDIMFKEV
jgi:hypothetical protein